MKILLLIAAACAVANADVLRVGGIENGSIEVCDENMDLQQLNENEMEYCYKFDDVNDPRYEQYKLRKSLRYFINSYTSIPKNLFNNLTHVRQLEIVIDNLDNFDGDEFENVSGLEELTLQAKSVRFGSGSFRYLSSVKALAFVNFPIKELPDNLFENTTNLTKLHLRSNELELSSLRNVPQNLEVLQLINQNLDELYAKVLERLPKLRELVIYECGLINLPSGIFKNNPHLERLVVSGNKLTTVSGDSFEGLTSLTYLDLYKNNIEGSLSRAEILEHLPKDVQFFYDEDEIHLV